MPHDPPGKCPARPPQDLGGDHHLQRRETHRRMPRVAALGGRDPGGRLLLHRPHSRDHPRLSQGDAPAAHLLRLGRAEELGDGPVPARLDPDLRRRRALHARAPRRRSRSCWRAGRSYEAYTIRRRVFFLGQRIRFSGWQHDQVIRLLRKGAGRYPNRRVHADMKTRGPAPLLEGADGPLHGRGFLQIRAADRQIQPMGRFAGLAGRQALGSGGGRRPLGLALFRTYILQLGIFDGMMGLVFLPSAGLRHLPQMGDPLVVAGQRETRRGARPARGRRKRGDLARASTSWEAAPAQPCAGQMSGQRL